MASNPDRKECTHLIPTDGQLRYIDIEMVKTTGAIQMLQRYEWSAHLRIWGWFDVDTVDKGQSND